MLSKIRIIANSYCNFYRYILKELHDKICNVQNVEGKAFVQKFIK